MQTDIFGMQTRRAGGRLRRANRAVAINITLPDPIMHKLCMTPDAFAPGRFPSTDGDFEFTRGLLLQVLLLGGIVV